MNKPKVSIIVPIYNAVDYLERCINSILTQEERNWELLLIDDGSKDNSYELCMRYAERDSRIIVSKKNNGGVSSARNYGIKIAKGEWLLFVDADDEIDQNVLSQLKLLDPNSEMAIFDCLRISNNHEDSLEHYSRKILRGKSYHDELHRYVNLQCMTGCCAKYFKTRIVQENNILFDESIHWGEDRLFNLAYLKYVKQLEFCGEGKYIYYLPSQQTSLNKYKISIPMISILYDRMKENCSQIQAVHMEYAYSGLWVIIEKLSLLSKHSLETDRKNFYKKHFSIGTLCKMKAIDIPFFIICSCFPRVLYKNLLKKYLNVK